MPLKKLKPFTKTIKIENSKKDLISFLNNIMTKKELSGILPGAVKGITKSNYNTIYKHYMILLYDIEYGENYKFRAFETEVNDEGIILKCTFNKLSQQLKQGIEDFFLKDNYHINRLGFIQEDKILNITVGFEKCEKGNGYIKILKNIELQNKNMLIGEAQSQDTLSNHLTKWQNECLVVKTVIKSIPISKKKIKDKISAAKFHENRHSILNSSDFDAYLSELYRRFWSLTLPTSSGKSTYPLHLHISKIFGFRSKNDKDLILMTTPQNINISGAYNDLYEMINEIKETEEDNFIPYAIVLLGQQEYISQLKKYISRENTTLFSPKLQNLLGNLRFKIQTIEAETNGDKGKIESEIRSFIKYNIDNLKNFFSNIDFWFFIGKFYPEYYMENNILYGKSNNLICFSTVDKLFHSYKSLTNKSAIYSKIKSKSNENKNDFFDYFATILYIADEENTTKTRIQHSLTKKSTITEELYKSLKSALVEDGVVDLNNNVAFNTIDLDTILNLFNTLSIIENSQNESSNTENIYYSLDTFLSYIYNKHNFQLLNTTNIDINKNDKMIKKISLVKFKELLISISNDGHLDTKHIIIKLKTQLMHKLFHLYILNLKETDLKQPSLKEDILDINLVAKYGKTNDFKIKDIVHLFQASSSMLLNNKGNTSMKYSIIDYNDFNKMIKVLVNDNSDNLGYLSDLSGDLNKIFFKLGTKTLEWYDKVFLNTNEEDYKTNNNTFIFKLREAISLSTNRQEDTRNQKLEEENPDNIYLQQYSLFKYSSSKYNNNSGEKGLEFGLEILSKTPERWILELIQSNKNIWVITQSGTNNLNNTLSCFDTTTKNNILEEVTFKSKNIDKEVKLLLKYQKNNNNRLNVKIEVIKKDNIDMVRYKDFISNKEKKDNQYIKESFNKIISTLTTSVTKKRRNTIIFSQRNAINIFDIRKFKIKEEYFFKIDNQSFIFTVIEKNVKYNLNYECNIIDNNSGSNYKFFIILANGSGKQEENNKENITSIIKHNNTKKIISIVISSYDTIGEGYNIRAESLNGSIEDTDNACIDMKYYNRINNEGNTLSTVLDSYFVEKNNLNNKEVILKENLNGIKQALSRSGREKIFDGIQTVYLSEEIIELLISYKNTDMYKKNKDTHNLFIETILDNIDTHYIPEITNTFKQQEQYWRQDIYNIRTKINISETGKYHKRISELTKKLFVNTIQKMNILEEIVEIFYDIDMELGLVEEENDFVLDIEGFISKNIEKFNNIFKQNLRNKTIDSIIDFLYEKGVSQQSIKYYIQYMYIPFLSEYLLSDGVISESTNLKDITLQALNTDMYYEYSDIVFINDKYNTIYVIDIKNNNNLGSEKNTIENMFKTDKFDKLEMLKINLNNQYPYYKIIFNVTSVSNITGTFINEVYKYQNIGSDIVFTSGAICSNADLLNLTTKLNNGE